MYEVEDNSFLPLKFESLFTDKFIAFKTPLDHRYDEEVPDECKFNMQMFMSSTKNSYHRSVGLIVDLTNTKRFYNTEEVESTGCKYVKLQCKGWVTSLSIHFSLYTLYVIYCCTIYC